MLSVKLSPATAKWPSDMAISCAAAVIGGVIVMVGLLGPLQGQQAKFTELYAVAARQAATGTARDAYATAFDAFERLSGPARRAALDQGTIAAIRAGRWGPAATVADAAIQAHGPSAARVGRSLESRLHVGRGADTAALARSSQAPFPAAVRQFLGRPQNFVALAQASGKLVQSGDSLGLWLLQAVARVLPNNPYASANLALALRQTGDFAGSFKRYLEALNLGRQHAWLWNDYGLMLKGSGEYEAAGRAFLAALAGEQAPGASAAGTNLGVLFRRTGKARGREAGKDLREVLRQRPDSAMARRLALDVLTGGQ